jgi:hypothetical protein
MQKPARGGLVYQSKKVRTSYCVPERAHLGVMQGCAHRQVRMISDAENEKPRSFAGF